MQLCDEENLTDMRDLAGIFLATVRILSCLSCLNCDTSINSHCKSKCLNLLRLDFKSAEHY